MPRALLIIDHGSRRQEANAMLESVADLLRALQPAIIVRSAHMELAEPTIAQGFKACVDAGAHDVTVHPYMLSPGRHSTVDIPRMVGDVAAAFPNITYRVTEPLGIHPDIAGVVLERSGFSPRADTTTNT